MMRLSLSVISWIAVCLVWSSSVLAESPSTWERASPDAQRVGFVVGDNGEEAESVADELSSRGARTGDVLVRKQVVDSDVDDHTVEAMERLREEGQELYFFEGFDVARDYLRNQIVGQIELTQPWMRNQVASTALFEAVIYLVRAHLEMDQPHQARRWMERLLRVFPAHQPEGEKFPPVVTKLWQQVYDDFDGEDTAVLELGAWAVDGHCQVRLNGAAVDSDEVTVPADRLYLISHRCDSESQTRSWWVGASPGQTRKVEAFYDGIDRDELDHQLSRIAKRRNLDAVVYVGPGPCDGTSTCVGIHRGELELRPLEGVEVTALLDEQ